MLPQFLRNKPVLLGLGVVVFAAVIVAIPRSSRNLDTPADALIGHWVIEGENIHYCYAKNGVETRYNVDTGNFSTSNYIIGEQNLKDFSLVTTGEPINIKVKFLDKARKAEVTVEPFVDSPNLIWLYVDSDVERCGRK